MSGTMKKKLPIGIENFRDIRTENFYYVDKTAMIRELLQRWAKVNLFTRPRRFGKSLNMSMLRSFFEIGEDPSLFEGLAISRETELCQTYMGQFPVVSISLKGVDAANYQTARNLAVKAINEEARRLRYLLDSDQLAPEDKILFSQFLDKDMADETLVCSLRELCELLEKHFGKKVILLIDEYDVPLAKAHEQGYYDPMVFLIRNLFSQALKTNDSLYFAVLTGCLRVARESIFTGLNNVKTLSITSFSFDEYFGFTDSEVQEMLQYYGAENKYEMVKNWYDGYRFGKVDVYCPWDVIRYCDELQDNPDAEPENYWSNTSSNDVVRHFLQQVDQGLTKSEMEALIAGEAVTKEITEELTYNHLYDSIDHLWSVLFATGYLTYRGKGSGNTYQLAIPNQMCIRDSLQPFLQVIAVVPDQIRKGPGVLPAVVQLHGISGRGEHGCQHRHLSVVLVHQPLGHLHLPGHGSGFHVHRLQVAEAPGAVDNPLVGGGEVVGMAGPGDVRPILLLEVHPVGHDLDQIPLVLFLERNVLFYRVLHHPVLQEKVLPDGCSGPVHFLAFHHGAQPFIRIHIRFLLLLPAIRFSSSVSIF